MKKVIVYFLLCIASSVTVLGAGGIDKWVRVNQLGYLPADVKVAVYISTVSDEVKHFELHDAATGAVVFKAKPLECAGAAKWGMKRAYRLNFSSFRKDGGYYLICGGAKSPVFKINADIYDATADYLLNYMRQQRCGYNPYTDTLCHQDDGYIVCHPTRSGEKIDVTGGWHDAADYLQYQTTSATATYQMLFAYIEQKDKSVFKDEYLANGKKGRNGIPDILDEAKWGLEWLMKMNPENKVMFSQIADDRDHIGMHLPQDDKIDYGWGPGKGRPVYFVTGKPEGLGKWINRTTGVSSVAGKFASSFAMGAQIFKDIDPEMAKKMETKAEQAYDFALEDPGNTQTACLRSPYFYEEDSYVDDIELAASTFYHYTGNAGWKKQADYWGQLEPVTPWMELGRARHYEWYPFVNLGHYYMAESSDSKISGKYIEFMREGLEDISKRAAGDPFMNGIPYVWCSNNLTSGAITQARLYQKASGDSTYVEMEAALRDWLFGCNPWGTSMIAGLPYYGDYPVEPHSSYVIVNHDIPYGGLVDGPVYKSVFTERAGKSLRHADSYAVFNNGIAVYHDDVGDYASNEQTMDGTASLIYYLAQKENEGLGYKKNVYVKDNLGVIRKINPDKKDIYLVFTADSLFNGIPSILKTLEDKNIKASFFLTGNCLRMREHRSLIKRMIKDGNYVGGHSDGHLLYSPWGQPDSSNFTYDEIIADLGRNMSELARFGIKIDDARWFLPPYEHCNKLSETALENAGMRVVNYTPGIATPADYTIPSMPSYKTSDELIAKLYAFEHANTLNGAILLIHPGVQPSRPDMLFERLGEIIESLQQKGYDFKSLGNIDDSDL
ncbi:MAG: glycoside hydrolase family 9 protein [Bacteroidales bacterium]|jgi:peptidoglycan/xylan/chitin deacetylase (PgdA/CDA1 family)|nr:glycoside hydrolase family 9 protein [Bacteroidales bacterium]MCI1785221.1 glycoside hydrolase family 9 protein [Bacteroidales bacterium]